MGTKGIFLRQTGDKIIFRESIKDSSGMPVITGSSYLRIFELQSSGSLKQYDFNDNTFKTTSLTTATASMTHATTDNSTYNTGLWTYVLSTVSGFTTGNVYIYSASNLFGTPPTIEREFQYGSAEGDMLVTSDGYIQSDLKQVNSNTTAAANLSTINAALETGTAQTGSSNTITLRSGAVASDDYYKNQAVFIVSGTGAGQTNRISSYVGSTKVASVTTTWVTQPDNTSIYMVIGRIG